ncbi:MAG TPA: FkbM family methyltransferase [Bacteroidia bacterium]|jgi:FkbM family methyltransferase|nr:FkbM family methyltransferase [Bacteroidia bacterium]
MFLEALKKELLKNGSNYYTDNYDHYTFGVKKPLKKSFINQLKRVFFSKPFLWVILSNNFLYRNFFLGFLFKYTKYIKPLEFFYDNLNSEESKNLLIQLTAFRLLGYVKVRLPLSTPQYWEGIKEMENIANTNESVEVRSFPWKLYLHDVDYTGYPIKVYLNSKAAYTTFIVKQYFKTINNIDLGPHKDDVVLDLGGCYGDTALQFGYVAGNKGKVYTFEFIPGNLEVMKKNLSLNPAIKDMVEIVEHPLWTTSGEKIYYKDAGAGSRVSFQQFEGSDGDITTISVDDFVAKYNINKLDLIKADIEGAEPYVLKGAINSLKRFTPRLAITIYHSMGDFTGIIKQIADLNLGYKFYLGHYTIYASETVLYAVKE